MAAEAPRRQDQAGSLSPTHWASRLLGLAVLAAVLLLAPLASASVTQKEQMGLRVLSELESGTLRCPKASESDFDHVGEYLMGRMVGSPRAHEAMGLHMLQRLSIGLLEPLPG